MNPDPTDPADRTDPISQVNNRLVPPQRVKQAKSVGIEVRLNQARRTFTSLTAAAQDPPLIQRREFDVPGLGKIRTAALSDFFIADEQGDGRLGFTCSFQYVGRDGLKYVSESEVAHNALRKALYGYGLVFRSVSGATVHKLDIEPTVPAHVMLVGAPAGKTIVVSMHNVAVLGNITYEIPAEALDRKLVDALVDLVSSGSGEFYQLIAKTGARHD